MKTPYLAPELQVLNIGLEHDVLAVSQSPIDDWNNGAINDDLWYELGEY